MLYLYAFTYKKITNKADFGGERPQLVFQNTQIFWFWDIMVILQLDNDFQEKAEVILRRSEETVAIFYI